MKRLILLLIVLLLSASGVLAQPLVIPAGLTEQAAAMFPGTDGPYEVRYKSDMRMHAMGFSVINYDVLAQGKTLGTVTRIVSVENPEIIVSVDFLLRFKPDGSVMFITPFYRNAEHRQQMEKHMPDLLMLLDFYRDKKPQDYQFATLVLANGLAAAQEFRDATAPPAPPEGFVLDLQQKILTTGAPLPAITMNSYQGKKFNTAGYKQPLIMVFANTRCGTCYDMIKVLETAKEKMIKAGKTAKILYVVTGKQEEVEGFAAAAGIENEFVVVDSADLVTRLFQVPFKPYALMFRDGKLLANAAWEGEDKFLGHIYMLLGGK